MVEGRKKVLEAKNIHVSFGGIKALRGVDLTLREGNILGLIGPNGAGKTTMVNVLSGFQRPVPGIVCLDGKNVSTLEKWHRRELPAAFRRRGSLEN
jgi:branched-chain amino acid transport system ATP-binding protein